MIYVWAAPRAAASDSLAQELRCSPIMIYMRSSPSPSPRGPPCAPARPRMPGAQPGLCKPGSAGCRAQPSRAQPSSAGPAQGESAGPCPVPPAPLPLSPGSVTIYSAPDEHGERSIFSSVQKVPIYLGAPILSRLPGVGRVGCERLCVSLSARRAVPREGGTKTVRGDKDTQREGLGKLKTFKEKSFSGRLRSQNLKVAVVLCHTAQHTENMDVLG